MKNSANYVTGLAIFVIQLILFCSIAYMFFSIFPKEISSSKCQKYLTKYEDEFYIIANSLLCSDKDHSYITKESFSTHSEINNEIDTVFNKCNCQLIYSNDKTVYFQLWSNLDYGRGVLYCQNPENLKNEFILELLPLEQECWYFYIEE